MIDYVSRIPCELLGPMLWPETNENDVKNVGECVETALSFAETSQENRQKIQSSFFLDFFRKKKNLFYYDSSQILPKEIPNFLSRELSLIKLQTNQPVKSPVSVKLLNPKQYYLENQVWSICNSISETDKKLITDTVGSYKCAISSPDFFVFNKGQTIFIYSKTKSQLVTSFFINDAIRSLGLKDGVIFVDTGKKQMHVFDIWKKEMKSVSVPWPSSIGKIYFGSTHLLALITKVVCCNDEPRNGIYLVSLDSIACCPENNFPPLLDLNTSFSSLFVKVFPEEENFILVYLKLGGLKILKVTLPFKRQKLPGEKEIKVEVLAKNIAFANTPIPHTKMFKDFFYPTGGILEREKLWKIFYLGGCLFAAVSKGKNFDVKNWDLRTKEIKTIFTRKIKRQEKPRVSFFSPNFHSVFLGIDGLSEERENSMAMSFEFFPKKGSDSQSKKIESSIEKKTHK